MTILLSISIALIAGLLLSRVTKLWNLPAVTAYLIAGILAGPYCLGLLGIEGIGFISRENVATFSIISDVALGFIALTMGNEFRLEEIKKTGTKAAVVGIIQAVAATLVVDTVLIGLHFLIPNVLPLSTAIVLGAVASATAPASTLMVIKQYKAEGPVTKMLLPIVAIDDVVGLVIFAISLGIAKAFEHGTVDAISVVVEPIIEVCASLALGAALGFIFSFTERFFHSRSKRLSISVCYTFLAVALSQLKFHIGSVAVGFSSLLVCMMLGTIFCNTCDFSEELMDRLDRWTGPLMVLFFVISGAGLELNVFTKWEIVVVGVAFVAGRAVGKIFGANASAKMMKCDGPIQKYLGITLLPQEGVALGMSLMALSLGEPGTIVRNITLFSVLIYELTAPLLTKIALTKAGEIKEKPIPPRKQAQIDKKAGK